MSSSWTPPPFSCTVVQADDRPHVVVHGELDLATVAELDGALHRLHDDGARAPVLDLSGVTFIDSTGVSAVLRWHIRLGGPDGDLSVRLGPAVEDVMALCGVLPRLRLHDTA